MPSDIIPFEDKDITLTIIQKAVAAIMNEVNSIDDILDDQKKARMFESVATFLNQAGIAMTEVFPAEIADAYTSGHNLGAELLSEAGVEEVAGNLTDRVHTAAVQAIAINGVSDMQAAIRTASAMFINDIQSILENAQAEMGKGILTGDATREITKRVQSHFAQNGLTSFITIDGRKLPLDFYSMTVTRTKVRQAHVEGAINRYQENDCDLVRFPIRSHTCHICGARERLVVSISGKTEGYPTAEEIGGLPPFHPNCRHYPIPVLDFERDQYPPRQFTGRDMRTNTSKNLYKDEQAIRRKANDEKKLYMQMKAEADANGESFPSIGTWRRMRRKNDQAWKDLQASYKRNVSKVQSSRQLVTPPTSNIEAIQKAQSTIQVVMQQAAARGQQSATISNISEIVMPDGSTRGATFEIFGNIKITTVDGLNKKRQKIKAENIKEYIQQIPEEHRSAITEIRLLDEYDQFGRKIFDKAVGGFNIETKVIEFYRNDKINKDSLPKIIADTVRHETAHAVESSLPPSFLKDWKKAMKKDFGNITEYAKTDIHEDVAETIMFHWSPDNMERRTVEMFFPERFKVLQKYGVKAGGNNDGN